MARMISYREAINEALALEMERDPSVIVMGEDNAGGEGSPGEEDAWGGVLGVTKGLYHRFPGRVLDTPISESAFVGAAIGAATAGLRPVAELMFIDFMGVCFDQIFNQAAKFRYMFGGKAETPVVIRTMYGAGLRAAAQHSQALYPIFTHVPGLKVVVPSSPYEAKGLLAQSIRDNDPVIFCEHKAMYDTQGDVPEGDFTIPLGEAKVVREGAQITLVAWSAMVHTALEAAELAAQKGISVEVIDLRTIVPWDVDTVIASVKKTVSDGLYCSPLAAKTPVQNFCTLFTTATMRQSSRWFASSPVLHSWESWEGVESSPTRWLSRGPSWPGRPSPPESAEKMR